MHCTTNRHCQELKQIPHNEPKLQKFIVQCIVALYWVISSFQPERDRELPVIPPVKMCSSRIPKS